MAEAPEWMAEFSKNLLLEQQSLLEQHLGPIKDEATYMRGGIQEIRAIVSKLETRVQELESTVRATHDARSTHAVSARLWTCKEEEKKCADEIKFDRKGSTLSQGADSSHPRKQHSWRRATTRPSLIFKDYISTVGESHPSAQALLNVKAWRERRSKPIVYTDWYHWTRFQLHSLLEEPHSSFSAFIVSALTSTSVMLSIVAFVLESLPSYSPDVHPQNAAVWFYLDLFFNTHFTAEYLTRLWSTSLGYVAFITNAMNIVDVMTVSPFWLERLPFVNRGGNLACLRVFRLLRVFRIFKLARFSVHLRIIAESMVWSLDPLILLAAFVGMAVFLFGVFLWFVERGDWDPTLNCFTHSDQEVPRCSPFQSIPLSMYWAVTTMTTVGYGDAVPSTNAGKAISCVAMLCGILVIAMPVSIVGTSFRKCYDSVKDDFKLEKVEDLSCVTRKSEEVADAQELKSLCEEVRQSHGRLTEMMPEIRALLRKHSRVVEHSKGGLDLMTTLCDAIQSNLDVEFSLLSDVLEDHAIDLVEQFQEIAAGG